MVDPIEIFCVGTPKVIFVTEHCRLCHHCSWAAKIAERTQTISLARLLQIRVSCAVIFASTDKCTVQVQCRCQTPAAYINCDEQTFVLAVHVVWHHRFLRGRGAVLSIQPLTILSPCWFVSMWVEMQVFRYMP